MASEIKISIVIPTFNRAVLLQQAIETSLSQTYQNLEVIVSDNASTDETHSIVARYQHDFRFKYFRNTENIGMIPNWRKCVYEYCTGDYFVIISDDDYFVDADYLSKAVSIIEQDKSISLLFANRINLYEETKSCVEFKNHYPAMRDGKEYFLESARRDVGFHLVTTLFSTQIARLIGVFKEDKLLSSDMLEFLRFCLHGNVGFISDCVAVYRKHRSNAWDNLNAKQLLFSSQFISKAYDEAVRMNSLSNAVLKKWQNEALRNYLLACFYNEIEKPKGTKKVLELVSAAYLNNWKSAVVFFAPKQLAIFVLRCLKSVGKYGYQKFCLRAG